MKWLSTIVHYLFVATCDFCSRELSKNDFNRICLNCAARLDNTQKVEVCKRCFQPLKPLPTSTTDSEPTLQKIQQEKICDACSTNDTFLKENRSLFFNMGLAQRLIYDFKFKPHSSYASIVTHWAIKKLSPYLKSFDVFVPIPLGKKGFYEREFCQVTKVTRILSRKLKKPIAKVIIRNEKSYKQAQHDLSAEEREASVKEKYLYLSQYRGRFDDKKILIVDDIYTTGSTLKNAARLFTENNKNVEVSSFTFLRTFLK